LTNHLNLSILENKVFFTSKQNIMQTFKKVFLLSCLILTIGGASVILAQSKDSTVDLTTNLANPIQHINKIIFAIPDNNPSNTGGWKTQ
jgi:hypothetical protein